VDIPQMFGMLLIKHQLLPWILGTVWDANP